MALAEQTNATLKSIPKTAAGFVKDFSGLKRSSDKSVMFAYLKNIPVAQVEAFFKRTEIESDILSSILDTLSSGLQTKEDCLWACKFLGSLVKADNFDLTISFAEDTDLDNIEKIFTKIKATAGAESEAAVCEL